MLQKLEDFEKSFPGLIKRDQPLAPYTTFKVGGPADLFTEVRDKEMLIKAYKEAKKLDIPVTVLGGGTNVLIGDKGIRGLVIKNLTKEITVRGIKGTYDHAEAKGIIFVEADSGVIFNSFVRFTVEAGYQGIEMHLGLPGTIGGAVYMNSKWTHPTGYVGDVVYQATILKDNGETEIVPKSYFQFAYDSSVLQSTHEILLSVTFAFNKKPKEDLWKLANESIAYRRETQPQGVFTPGCTFRNISEAEALSVPTPNKTRSAGFLIDATGLKGEMVGNAQVSPVHANFIVNNGGATAKDIVQLIDRIKQKVKMSYGITLEEEIVKIGEF